MNVIMESFTILLAAISTWQIIEIWHHSHLFSGLRARVDLWEGRAGQLLRCPFCLSPWVAALSYISVSLGLYWTVSESQWIQSAGLMLYLPFVILAISRLANLANDLFHFVCRTPKANELDDP